MDDRFQYLALLGGCLLITLPLEWVLRARVYRRPVRTALALAPTLILFAALDVIGVQRGYWTYNPRFVSGWHLGVLPVEEVAFFVVVPLCGLLTFGAVGYVLRRLSRSGR